MLAALAWLVLGVVALLLGAQALVRGAAGLARSLGVSDLVIGMTVVAFGTSAPELVVNLTAAWRGESDVAFGNVVGSNLGNVGLILGLAALLRPLAVHEGVVSREIPMLILASAAALAMGLDPGRAAGERAFDRADGLVLLLLFGVFLYYTIGALLPRRGDPFAEEASAAGSALRSGGRLGAVGLVALGLLLLVAGARLTVAGALALAEAAGVAPSVVALTIVAVGTSLPELATSLVAVWRGQDDLAVGNVVGSNLFNVLFILGLGALLSPVAVPAGGAGDLWMMAGLAGALLVLSFTHRRRIVRWEGGALLLAYAGYLGWRCLGTP